MTPYYEDPWLTVYQGDNRAVLRELPAESVHCVVTSPPYWGLRDYGTEGQLGLEPTPEEYVANLVDVFREVRRVLRSDGTVWLNLGDSYAGSGKGGNPEGSPWSGFVGSAGREASAQASKPYLGLAQKQLVGIPWRVAFALQADGWYLRSDIIWSKPNPMPESVTDRPTKSHEYLFLLSKSPRYYFDAAAVAEPLADTSIERLSQPTLDEQAGSDRVPGKTNGPMKAVGKLTGGAYAPPGQPPSSNARDGQRCMCALSQFGETCHCGHPYHGWSLCKAPLTGPAERGGTRNIRTVWTIATQPYPGAHFATFPRKLVEPCVKAGTSERGVCPECGAPWVRVVERPTEPEGLRNRGNGAKLDYHTRQTGSGQKLQDWMDANPKETTGWKPTCDHLHYWEADSEADAVTGGPDQPWPRPYPAPIPATVLDPFGGSGTTGAVAQSLGRRAILIDLNGDYLVQALERNRDIPLGLSA